jgi:hypothetical protein
MGNEKQADTRNIFVLMLKFLPNLTKIPSLRVPKIQTISAAG